MNDPYFEPCSAEGCDRTASEPPCLSHDDFRPLCSVCAADAAGGKCTHCSAPFVDTYNGFDVYTLDFGALEGAPLCIDCAGSIGNNPAEHIGHGLYRTIQTALNRELFGRRHARGRRSGRRKASKP